MYSQYGALAVTIEVSPSFDGPAAVTGFAPSLAELAAILRDNKVRASARVRVCTRLRVCMCVRVRVRVCVCVCVCLRF